MKPELLAPAKNLEIAIAAINQGADAVYIGAPKFGARQAAGNTLTEIEHAIAYAHRYRAKVFVALNTLLYESELEEAQTIATRLYEMEADALIVQDMAFLEMDLPPIPLHASTQTHNHSAQKIKFLHEVGFSRVVLARELSPKQIAEIHKVTKVELEAFVHGALCVSYSGQCYISHALTKRSANRGACMQACRSTYNLIDSKGSTLVRDKHLLSLKDLNLSGQLKALAQAGVCSFKIEGRLKDMAYVKNTVAWYRREIDRVFEGEAKASSGQVIHSFVPNLHKTFSRGFTTYFADNNKQMASLHTAKSVGEYIGKIQQISKNCLRLSNLSTSLRAGDGLVFFDAKGQLYGTNINQVEGNQVYVQKTLGAVLGGDLFRNLDLVFQRDLLRKDTVQRLIELRFTFTETQDEVSITAVDEDNTRVQLSYPRERIMANNSDKVKGIIQQQFAKIKDSGYLCQEVNFTHPLLGFYTIGELNAYKREIIAQLEQKRHEAYPLSSIPIVKNDTPYPAKELDFGGNVLNTLAEQFYKRHQVQKIAEGYECQKPLGRVALMTCRYCLLKELNWCKRSKSPRRLHEPLFLENNGRRFELRFDCKNCQMQLLG
ncbi:MAG: peptidase U32 family protein [Bacteroidales bacterium]